MVVKVKYIHYVNPISWKIGKVSFTHKLQYARTIRFVTRTWLVSKRMSLMCIWVENQIYLISIAYCLIFKLWFTSILIMQSINDIHSNIKPMFVIFPSFSLFRLSGPTSLSKNVNFEFTFYNVWLHARYVFSALHKITTWSHQRFPSQFLKKLLILAPF